MVLLSPGGQVFQADPVPPRVSHLHGLFHAPCPAVCRDRNPPMIRTWASLTPLWAGPCSFFPCPSSSQRFSSSPSVSFHSEMTLVCVMKKLISQVISPQCLLHIFLLFPILLCVAVTFLSSLPPHQNIDLQICRLSEFQTPLNSLMSALTSPTKPPLHAEACTVTPRDESFLPAVRLISNMAI